MRLFKLLSTLWSVKHWKYNIISIALLEYVLCVCIALACRSCMYVLLSLVAHMYALLSLVTHVCMYCPRNYLHPEIRKKEIISFMLNYGNICTLRKRFHAWLPVKSIESNRQNFWLDSPQFPRTWDWYCWFRFLIETLNLALKSLKLGWPRSE